jgi:chorismate mutase
MSADPTHELHAMRAEIDALNLALRELLQQRAQVCRRIARHKKRHGLPLVDPSREADMVMRLLRDSGEGFSPESLARIFGALLDESRSIVLDEGDDRSS